MSALFSCKYKAGIYTFNDGQTVKFENGLFQTDNEEIVNKLKKHHAMGEEIALMRDLESEAPKPKATRKPKTIEE